MSLEEAETALRHEKWIRIAVYFYRFIDRVGLNLVREAGLGDVGIDLLPKLARATRLAHAGFSA